MSFVSILAQIREFFMIAAPASLVITLVFGFIHKFILKKELPLWKLVSGFLLIMIISFIAYLTFFSRSETYASYDIHAFRSYREAWNSFSIRNWQLVIFNILVFLPVGFLLPLTLNIMRKGYRTVILGILFSAGIEFGQYYTKLGLCELDDLINNSLGIILGYCLFRVLYTFVDDKKFKLVKCFLALIPICIIVGGFGSIFYLYENQPFGNLPINYTYQVDMSNTDFRVQVGVLLRTQSDEGHIYIPKSYSKTQAEAFATHQLNRMGVEGKDKLSYDGSLLTLKRGDYRMMVNLDDQSYHISRLAEKNMDIQADMGILNVKKKLQEYDIEIPKGAVLTKPEEGAYVWSIERNDEHASGVTGTLYCRTTQEGEIFEIENRMITFDSDVRVELVSEREAANRLKNGYFYWDIHNGEIRTLKITGLELTYSQDTKGYYQPVYLFHCVVNGENRDFVIPAYEQNDLGKVYMAKIEEKIKEIINR